MVRVTLPDLSSLRQSVPILSGHLANGPADASACGRFLAGSAAPRSTWRQAAAARFALVLSEGTARAITSGTGGPYEVASLPTTTTGASSPFGLERLRGRRSRRWRSCPPRSPRIRRCGRSRGRCWRGLAHGARLWHQRRSTWLRWPHQIASAVIVVVCWLSAWLLPLASIAECSSRHRSSGWRSPCSSCRRSPHCPRDAAVGHGAGWRRRTILAPASDHVRAGRHPAGPGRPGNRRSRCSMSCAPARNSSWLATRRAAGR